VLTGALALVVDAGVFFVTQRQLQTAVDAATLAAVWYLPACNQFVANADCLATPPASMPPQRWGCSTPADCVANAIAQENLGYSGALCQDLQIAPPGRTTTEQTGNGPLTYYVMSVRCEAPYWFARIFPGIPLRMPIAAFARATIGHPSPTGVTAQGLATDLLIARLVT